MNCEKCGKAFTPTADEKLCSDCGNIEGIKKVSAKFAEMSATNFTSDEDKYAKFASGF